MPLPRNAFFHVIFYPVFKRRYNLNDVPRMSLRASTSNVIITRILEDNN